VARVAGGSKSDDAERELLYGKILALHRDVREILRSCTTGVGG
jgi:hypothetical protein